MKLEEIAQVMIGVLVKREKSEDGNYSYPLFSLKNYEENEEFEQLNTDKDLAGKLAQKGDLLFRLVYPNKIIYVDEKLEGTIIPSQFYIIRVDPKKMDSIVLKWYLETDKAVEEQKNSNTGSIIQSMSISSLKNIEIPKVSNDNQEKIKKLILLWEKEKEISKKIIEQKNRLYNCYMEEMLK